MVKRLVVVEKNCGGSGVGRIGGGVVVAVVVVVVLVYFRHTGRLQKSLRTRAALDGNLKPIAMRMKYAQTFGVVGANTEALQLGHHVK